MIEVNIPIGLNNVDSLINLEDILVDKVYDNFNNVIITENIDTPIKNIDNNSIKKSEGKIRDFLFENTNIVKNITQI